jgi:hypothetical protein
MSIIIDRSRAAATLALLALAGCHVHRTPAFQTFATPWASA